MAYRDHQKEYRKIAREAAKFAKMVADFPLMGSGEFRKLYPDYDYNGTDYICRRAEELAAKLSAYAVANESPSRKAA